MGSPLGLLKPRLMEVVPFAGLRRRSLQRACGGVYDDTSQHLTLFWGLWYRALYSSDSPNSMFRVGGWDGKSSWCCILGQKRALSWKKQDDPNSAPESLRVVSHFPLLCHALSRRFAVRNVGFVFGGLR